MLDRPLARLIKPWLDGIAARLILLGLQANTLTLTGFAIGLMSAGMIACGYFLSGLALLIVSRIFDGLDGAVARLSTSTDRGGFLDIVCDFIVYASIPLAFAIEQPTTNALAAATLLFAFMGTSSSFLAYASIAAKRGHAPSLGKHLRYLGGMSEAFETLLCFALMCGWPQNFAVLAYGFSAICFATAVARIYAGWQDF